MEVASTAVSRAKKLTLLLLRVGFNSSKCKTAAKMSVARIKLLRNKRQAVVKQMRRDIALLLQSGQDATARVRVEHVMREQNILAANELIELFCELLVTRLQMVAKQRECPADLKEGIASLIFAAPRCSEIPELAEIRKIFEKKYGKDFVSAAIELRPNCGVNRMLIDKLSVRTPTGETKLKVLKEIAKEYQIEWDTTETESELLKPPEEKIGGPKNFVSAASFPVKPAGFQPANLIDPSPSNRRETALYNDTGSAADAAAESARKAIAAAQAAAFLASKDSNQATGSSMPTDFSKFVHNPPTEASEAMYRPQTNEKHASNEERWCSPHVETERVYRRHSHNSVGSTLTEKRSESGESVEKSHFLGWDDFLSPHASDRNVNRRHSYNNAPSTRGGIKFDESDSDEEEADPTGEACPPPERPPPSMPPSHLKRDMTPRVHPKLPDYDDLAARFEALKYQK